MIRYAAGTFSGVFTTWWIVLPVAIGAAGGVVPVVPAEASGGEGVPVIRPKARQTATPEPTGTPGRWGMWAALLLIGMACWAPRPTMADAPRTSAPAPRPAHSPWQVGGEKQLFIDHRFIELSENITLAVNPPVKGPKDVFQNNLPWEAFRIGWTCVAEDDGVFKMWYAACDGDQWAGGRWRLCYAVSADGLTWDKPHLGLVEFQGSRQNNILLDDIKLAWVFIDPHGTPEQRYKMVHSGSRLATSPDGIHWDVADVRMSKLPDGWDTQKQAWWDTRLNRYVVYVRVQQEKHERTVPYPFVSPIPSNPPVVAPMLTRPIRALGRVEMDDITRPWPTETTRTVLAADEHDPPDSDIYHHGVYPYPYAADAYFMFPLVYHHFRDGESPVYNDGVLGVQFCASRDGIHWMRYDRRPYIPRGLPGEMDHNGTHAQAIHVRKGDYLYQYYHAERWTHGGFRRLSAAERKDKANQSQGTFNVVVQRLDGFVSADAPYTGGWLTTPPILFKGKRLELNINVAAMGQARVELQHPDGTPIPGYALADCDRILFNDVAYPVTWKGKPNVAELSGRPIRLKVAMRSAKLYAFQFSDK